MAALEGFMLGGVVLALLAPFLSRGMGRSFGVFAALLPLSSLVYLVTSLERPSDLWQRAWAPELGLDWALQNDRLGVFFALIISGIGALVFIYSGFYAAKEHLPRLMALLSLFYSAMLGIAWAGNAFTLFLFWEATSIVSFLLIGFNGESLAGRRSALQALLVTGSGGLILMGGLILLTQQNGTPILAHWTEADPLAMSLVVVGCLTKSAQFPFHFWLPNAMAAPTPVSAYLHSATMVKAGVFLLFRLMPLFGTQTVIMWIGGITLLWGGLLALREFDLKRIFAWATVSALGGMVMLAGVGTPKAARALAIVILAHALYKGALFLCVGAIEKAYGSRNLADITGSFRSSPAIATAYLLAGLAFAGIFPFAGFVAKESMLEATSSPLLFIVVGSGFLYAITFVRAVVRPMLGPAVPEIKKLNPGLTIPPLILAVGGLVASFALGQIGSFNDQMVRGLGFDFETGYPLGLWHGVTTELILGTGALAAGLVVGWFWPQVAGKAQAHARGSAERGWSLMSKIVSEYGSAVAAVTERYSIREHMFVFFGSFVALFIACVIADPFVVRLPGGPGLLVNEAVVIIIACIASLAVIRVANRQGAIAVLGMVGVSFALTFVAFSAPDLALTQALIDVLTIVLFVLVYSRLPRFTDLLSRRSKVANWTVAILFGACMSWVCLGVLSQPPVDPISRFYAETAVPNGHGRNVTNVIIVDFRAMDTMGEVTVLCLAALGVHALLRLKPEIKEKRS